MKLSLRIKLVLVIASHLFGPPLIERLAFLSSYLIFIGKTHPWRAEMMTGMEIFFYLALPVSIVTAGWIAVRLNEWNDKKTQLHPSE
ncbi:hypothetical protein [Agrobacterium rubi]|uniref:Uncharacterized protein n=1 Tax=Agrobacterium rubi TaxID=28099 RepID=A0AAE7R3T4_9HYPH|nr:hypothetical protein [Agrobacterium rubi]NTE86188.1 hypothetical protein [Agrobacterium rubi]NTF02119.1 hypothetical protein [Agrobacterium rubi]NTF36363.1 hypothetical protein [Agrobacterium rubi]OCJ44360.1 hypothetical protein A6U92_18230 [Agrobacterium rubi]QTG01440.1 hypothetical protein G6M88_14045 [Agrobacterium rubi]